MKQIKKSLLLPLVLFVFATGMFAYFVPKNGHLSLETIATIVIEYIVIIGLWLALRRKERLQRERLEDIEIAKNKHNTDN